MARPALTAPQALIKAGARVHAIRSTARPTMQIAADPQNPETMRELARVVRTTGAELGIGWDGDGDRIGVLDHLGRRYEADWLTALLARPLLARSPGAEILLDMKTSSSAIDDIRLRGGHPGIGEDRLLLLSPHDARAANRLRRRDQRTPHVRA